VDDLQLRAGLGEVAGAVAAAVVAEDALDRYAAASEVSGGASEEAGRRRCLLVWEQLDIDDAAVVVDADVQVLVAGAGLEASSAAAEDAVAWPVEASELLDVEVHELARPLMLVAVDRLERLQPRAAAESLAACIALFGAYAGAAVAGAFVVNVTYDAVDSFPGDSVCNRTTSRFPAACTG
jgi:hypothetical protein